MKAAVSTGVGQGFKVQDVDLAEPVGREVLVDVKASGLCHSDLHLVKEDYGFPMPAVFGHEVAGVVAAVGPEVDGIAVGDHVVASLIQFCGSCENCAAGHTYDCLHPERTLRPGDNNRITQGADTIVQAFGIGGFAERVIVHENQLAVVNNEIPFPQASLLGCGTITGAGAAINAAGVRFGDTVAVIGTGGVGLNTISGARIAGASRIIAIDINDLKLDVAKKFGATDVINSSEVDPVEAVRELTGGGVNYAFEVIGLTVTQKQALGMVKKGGATYLVGLGRPGSSLPIETSLEAITNRVKVEYVNMGSTNLKHDIPAFADLYVQGRIDLDDLVSREISIDQIEDAYGALERGEVIRSVITRF